MELFIDKNTRISIYKTVKQYIDSDFERYKNGNGDIIGLCYWLTICSNIKYSNLETVFPEFKQIKPKSKWKKDNDYWWTLQPKTNTRGGKIIEMINLAKNSDK